MDEDIIVSSKVRQLEFEAFILRSKIQRMPGANQGPGDPLSTSAQMRGALDEDNIVSSKVRQLEFEVAILRSKIQRMQGANQGACALAAKGARLRTIKKGMGQARQSKTR